MTLMRWVCCRSVSGRPKVVEGRERLHRPEDWRYMRRLQLRLKKGRKCEVEGVGEMPNEQLQLRREAGKRWMVIEAIHSSQSSDLRLEYRFGSVATVNPTWSAGRGLRVAVEEECITF